MKLTYQTLPNDDDEEDDILEAEIENAESEAMPGSDNRNSKHWDDDCPWSEWYSSEDPLKGKLMFELLISLYSAGGGGKLCKLSRTAFSFLHF